jgi:hypothetical protein
MTSGEPQTAVLNTLDTEHYLETFLGPTWDTTPLVVQLFDDNRDRKKQATALAKAEGTGRGKDRYARVLPGTWERLKERLITQNKNGVGVFLTINATKNGRRKTEDLTGIRAIWNEHDSVDPLPDWPLTPHMVVESSPQKFHSYWLVDASVSPVAFARLMAVQVRCWQSDPSAADAVRVLRIPGFLHQKVDSTKGLVGTPWLVRLVSCESRDALPLRLAV